MLGFMVEPMTSLVFEIFQPLVTAGFLVLTVVKAVIIVNKLVRPALLWVRDNRQDSLRRTLVYFGIIVDDEDDDT